MKLRSSREYLPAVDQDLCERAYDIAIEQIYAQAEVGKTFEERILFPVIDAAQQVENQSVVRLNKSEKHRLQSEVIYDVLYRLRNAGELSEEDQINWRQTDDLGEEWVEYTNASGVEFALNCPGLKYNSGNIQKNKLAKQYAALFDRSYLYENEYSVIKKIYSTSSEKKKRFNSIKKIRRALGTGALAAATLTGGYAATTLAQSLWHNQPVVSKVDNPDQKVQPKTSGVAKEVTSTTEVYIPYRTSPIDSPLNEKGELIKPAFTVSIPGICENNISVYEIDQSRVDQIGEFRNATPADVMMPDPTPLQNGCARVDSQPNLISRTERVRKEFDIINGRKVTASYYQPIAVHLNDNMYPGEAGNFVVIGHGSTKNAAFADIVALKPGDEMTISRDDGKAYVYTYAERQVIKVPSINDHSPEAETKRREFTSQVWGYKNNGSTATAAIVRCGDEQGNPGDDATRVVDYWILKAEVVTGIA